MRFALEQACVRLGGRIVLDGLDLALARRGITVVMGLSGIGKTTLLNAMAGLVPLDGGRRRIDGRVAMVFQDARLVPWQSALDNAGFGVRALGAGKAHAREQAAAWLARTGLACEHWYKRPDALSGGMQRRVALARALAVVPDLLLMDEPFTGLDMASCTRLRDVLRQWAAERELAILCVSHDPVEAALLADRIVVLGGAPATARVDLPVSPRPADAAEAYAFAAGFMRHPEVAALLASGEEDHPV
ncbi:ABC transporter ATP-binding protein [Dyella sedimenti]|jgi:NitT/TauT family transport system ATP-binding protein|uniref:ABC transporter ATP-binding protein n=1 Tax=Dyella sedimenti TaxID=2919947 RepID=UPI001FA95137|nr:ATP-binding cassette domain-containing protein [Dyella sedimenti]